MHTTIHALSTHAACMLHTHCIHTTAHIPGYADKTALSIACKAGFHDVCTLLVGRGARLHNENEDESPAEVSRRPPTRVRGARSRTPNCTCAGAPTPRPRHGRCSRRRATLSFWPSSRFSRSSATARRNMSACGVRASRAVGTCCFRLASRPLLSAPCCHVAPAVTAEMPVLACRRRAYGGG